jgi:hypothetical protein
MKIQHPNDGFVNKWDIYKIHILKHELILKGKNDINPNQKDEKRLSTSCWRMKKNNIHKINRLHIKSRDYNFKERYEWMSMTVG